VAALDVGVRVVLSLVLATAGAAKLADLAGTERSARALGAPARLVRTVARVLPAVEVGLAAGLLAPPTAWAAAIGASVLFLAFAALVATNLARGNRPSCHCFGALSRDRVGPNTVFRNGALFAAALVLVLGGRP